MSHGGRHDIQKHFETSKHKLAVKARKGAQSLTSHWHSATASAEGDRTIAAEVLFTGFLLEHNLPIAAADAAGKLFPKMFPDSKIAPKYHCGRTKTTHIINGAIAPELKSQVKAMIDESPWFCLATDASSDECDKYLPVLIRHQNPTTGRIITSLLDMPAISKGDAASLFTTCDAVIQEADLSWKHCVAYSSDNASVMIGRHNSLLSKIRDAQKDAGAVQSVFDVGCPCHLCHLCAQKGAKALSVKVENVIIDLYYHFEKSVKRKAELREYMEFTEVEVRKVLKHVSTRWLSLGKSVTRTLQQWDGLKPYFLSKFGDLAQKSGERENRLVKIFKDPYSKLYFLFVQQVIGMFDTLNTVLQAEHPLVNVIHQLLATLHRQLLSCFVKPNVITSTSDVVAIDLSSDNLLSISEVQVGLQALQYAATEELDANPEKYNRFFQDALGFYMNCTLYMRKSIPILKSNVLQSLTFLSPRHRQKAKVTEILALTARFPEILFRTGPSAKKRGLAPPGPSAHIYAAGPAFDGASSFYIEQRMASSKTGPDRSI